MLDGKYLFCECLNFQQRFVIIPVEIDVMIIDPLLTNEKIIESILIRFLFSMR